MDQRSDQKSVLAAAAAVEAAVGSGVGGVTSSSASGAKDGGVGGGGRGESVASTSPIPPVSESPMEIHMTENMTEIERLVVEATELAAWHDGIG